MPWYSQVRAEQPFLQPRGSLCVLIWEAAEEEVTHPGVGWGEISGWWGN